MVIFFSIQQQVKKDYHMNPEEFETFQQKVETDNLQRRASFKKINQKLDDRHRRKELKKNFQQHTHCITQWEKKCILKVYSSCKDLKKTLAQLFVYFTENIFRCRKNVFVYLSIHFKIWLEKARDSLSPFKTLSFPSPYFENLHV